MKKKFYLLLISLMICVALSAQTLIDEDFTSGSMPPAGWTIDAHSANWSAEETQNAGGTAPEAVFNWSPEFVGTTRLISPSINTEGFANLLIVFNQFLDDYSGSGYSIGVASRSASGPWTTVWELDVPGNIGPETKVVLIQNSDVGSDDFQFCIFFDGNSYNLDYWYIDNIEVFVPATTDAEMAALTMPMYSDGEITISGKVLNMGLDEITSLDIFTQVDNEPVQDWSYGDLTLTTGNVFDFAGDELDLTPGDHQFRAWVMYVNGSEDDNPVNDTLEMTLHVASSSVARMPFYEEFTSSTCGPCATFNTNTFNPWLNVHGDEITLLKYQMSWPSPGDPYYTAEGGTRRYYYGVGFVPDLYVDGVQTATTGSGINNALNNSLDNPAFAELYAYHAIEGTNITVNLDILPYITGTFEAYIGVFEYITTGNVSTNGETEFHHVMMKMMPDADGTTLELLDGNMIGLEFTTDLSTTNVEEMNDLGVVVFLQEPITRMIFQAAYSEASGVGIPDQDNAGSIRFFPSPSSGLLKVSGLNGAVDLSIYTVYGQLVRQINGFSNATLDLQDLASGTYFIRTSGTASRMITISK